MQLLRLSRLAILLAACSSTALAERTVAVVGLHPDSQTVDRGDGIRTDLQVRISSLGLEAAGDFGSPLGSVLETLQVERDDGVEALINQLRFRYEKQPPDAFLVVAGRFISDENGTDSVIYFGDPVQGVFEQAGIQANIMSSDVFAEEVIFLKVALCYSIAKHAYLEGQDFRTVISPLRQYAIELAADLDQNRFVGLEQILIDLENLQP